jgi:hypothetical protein
MEGRADISPDAIAADADIDVEGGAPSSALAVARIVAAADVAASAPVSFNTARREGLRPRRWLCFASSDCVMARSASHYKWLVYEREAAMRISLFFLSER